MEISFTGDFEDISHALDIFVSAVHNRLIQITEGTTFEDFQVWSGM